MRDAWLNLALLGLFLGGPFQALLAQGSPLAHWESGSGSPLVVVLHGGPGVPHDYLLPEWGRLEEFATVLFYDQRGCGGSKDLPEPWGWTAHVSDLDVLIREHAEERSVILAGSSWGALLALLYALEGEEPISGIVLSGYPGWLGPRILLPSDRPIHLWARLDSLERGLLDPSAPEPDTLSSGNSLGAQEADSIVTIRALPTAATEARARILASFPTMPPFQSLVELKTPVLIISGDSGRGVRSDRSAARLAAAVHNPQRIVIREAGHDPWAADPEAFFGAVQAFVQELGLRGGPALSRGGGV